MTFLPIEPGYTGYLSDESRLVGAAESIVFPSDTAELADAIMYTGKENLPFTLQGSRTGLCGGAVPQGGVVVSLEKMNRILDFYEKNGVSFLRVQAGATLEEIEKFALSKGRFFPPDPTEKSATIGGIFATGGAGPSRLFFGDSSLYIEALTWVAPDGEVLEFERGEYTFGANRIPPDGTETEPGKPGASGASSPDSGTKPSEKDLIDLLAGSEGQLGAAAELTLRLLPLPGHTWGVVFFFTEPGGCESFFSALGGMSGGADLICAEYFDYGALRLLDEEKENSELLRKLPGFPENAQSAVYIEIAGNDGEALDDVLAECLEMFYESGGQDENSWAENSPQGIKRFRDMRHAVPEVIGSKTGVPGGRRTRLETDFAGPADKAAEYIRMYRDGAEKAGVECAVYGHVLQHRLHAALIYKSEEQFVAANRLIGEWTETVLRDGGRFVCENGFGKLKAGLYNYKGTGSNPENLA